MEEEEDSEEEDMEEEEDSEEDDMEDEEDSEEEDMEEEEDSEEEDTGVTHLSLIQTCFDEQPEIYSVRPVSFAHLYLKQPLLLLVSSNTFGLLAITPLVLVTTGGFCAHCL